MRKAEYQVTVICPFNYCRMDNDITKMHSSCLFTCKFAELKKEMIGETIILTDDSQEAKEYEKKYSHCYQSNEDIESITDNY